MKQKYKAQENVYVTIMCLSSVDFTSIRNKRQHFELCMLSQIKESTLLHESFQTLSCCYKMRRQKTKETLKFYCACKNAASFNPSLCLIS